MKGLSTFIWHGISLSETMSMANFYLDELLNSLI